MGFDIADWIDLPRVKTSTGTQTLPEGNTEIPAYRI